MTDPKQLCRAHVSAVSHLLNGLEWITELTKEKKLVAYSLL